MRKINELVVRGDPSEVARLGERIEQATPNGWMRDRDIEGKLWRPATTPPATYCFSKKDAPDQPAAYLLLWKGRDELHVSNIMPIDRKPLTDEQYNQILDRFHKEFLGPNLDGVAVNAMIYPFRVKMEKILSREGLEKLESFSKTTDKVTLGPLARRRWFRFITQVHMDGSVLDSEELDWSLCEAGWPEEQRRQLIEWYEEGLSMLKDYDEARVG